MGGPLRSVPNLEAATATSLTAPSTPAMELFVLTLTVQAPSLASRHLRTDLLIGFPVMAR